MLAIRYRIALLLEVAAWSAIAVALARWAWWPMAAAIAFVAVAMLAIRLLLNAFTFMVGWRHRSPRASLGLAGSLALAAREYAAFLRFGLLDVPFDAYRLRADPPLAASQGLPIVLIHGYWANRGCFRRLARALEAQGHGPVFTPNLRSFDGAIEDYEAGLHAELERITRATGGKVLLVAHSMGGLGARAYLARHGESRVAALVTIASPHHGTALARLGRGTNARQMRIGSGFLRELEAREAKSPRAIPTTCLYSPHDNMVMPQDGARLEWARNVVVPGVAHLSILEDPRLCEAIREALEDARG
jgi:triacylglycerol lipase